jgi:hypothetical protein
MRPGNAGGGKDPDFWYAFDDGEEGVIGDEPRNARQDQEPSEEALLQGEGGACLLCRRHKVQGRGTKQFSREHVYGELEVLCLRRERRKPPPRALR